MQESKEFAERLAELEAQFALGATVGVRAAASAAI